MNQVWQNYRICQIHQTLATPSFHHLSMLNWQFASSIIAIPYTAKLSGEKTFAVVHKAHYSLENFRDASGRGHHVLYTANDSRVKLSRLAKKTVKTAKVLPYTVCAVGVVLMMMCV